jgi:putative thiamine transport system ATP-binding protein
VAPGEVLTLMGPSGSGKSTLFAWMIGALAGDFRAEGELWLNGRRCDTLPTERRRIGILFQDPLLFDHFSVGQNLQLALPESVRGEARKAAVEQALSRAGLAWLRRARSGHALRRTAGAGEPAARPAGAPRGAAAG